MISSNSLDYVVFPVRATLRDGETSLVVREDGKVFCGKAPTEHKLLAECSPESPAFHPFMFFWAVVFIENRLSLALNQVVSDMLSGRMEQDRDCPSLFIDKARVFMSEQDKEKVLAYQVLKADNDGNLTYYNPDPYYVNCCWALADNTRIKHFVIIEDHYGHDLPVGWSVGITKQAGVPPVFDHSYRTDNDLEILAMGEALLEAQPEPAHAKLPEPPDPDSPF